MENLLIYYRNDLKFYKLEFKNTKIKKNKKINILNHNKKACKIVFIKYKLKNIAKNSIKNKIVF